jgi:hypothetical protein
VHVPLSLCIYANANCGCVVCLVPVLCHSTPAKGVVVVAGIALGPVDPGTGRAGMNTVLENAGNRSVSAETPYHLQFFKSLSLFKFPRKERWSGSRPRFFTLSLCFSACPATVREITKKVAEETRPFAAFRADGVDSILNLWKRVFRLECVCVWLGSCRDGCS